MFGTIRRHQKWLWWLVAGLTILGFGVFGPSAVNGLKFSGASGSGLGMIGDTPISRDELVSAHREVMIRNYLSTQQWPENSDFSRDDYIRVFLIRKEKQFGVQVSPESLGEYARRILGKARLEDFVTQLLKPARLNEDDFERFLTHEIGAQQLSAVAGLSGKLVTPGEAETLYREEHQDVACSMILLTVSNYLSGVTVSNAALMEFYTNRMPVYKEPAKVQVNYVKFNVTNYWTNAIQSMTNLETMVDVEVKKAGTNLFGKAKTPEESRAAIRDYMIRTNALTKAKVDAKKFAGELDAMQPKKAEGFETLAKQAGLAAKTTAPFDEVEGPKDFDTQFGFTKTAFQLAADEPFSGPVMEQDGVYVLGFNQQIPSMVPAFAAIQAKVTEDFRTFQASMALQRGVIALYENLTNGLAHGKTFNVLAAELGVKTESLPPFSLSTPTKLPDAIEDRVSLGALRQAAFSTGVGGVSQPARAQHGAVIVYVEKKLPLDELKIKTDMPGFLAYVRQARQGDAFNQWFSAEVRQDPNFMALMQKVSQEESARPNSRRAAR